MRSRKWRRVRQHQLHRLAVLLGDPGTQRRVPVDQPGVGGLERRHLLGLDELGLGFLQLALTPLQLAGHVVERFGQRADLVVAADAGALGQVTARDGLRGAHQRIERIDNQA